MSTPLTSLDRTACRTLRAALEKALANVTDDFGVGISLGSMNFMPGPDGQMTVKLTVTPAQVSATGTVSAKTPEEAAFERYASMYGMEPEWLGKTLMLGGREYTIAGLNPRATKNNVFLKPSGRNRQKNRRVCPAAAVVTAMARAAA